MIYSQIVINLKNIITEKKIKIYKYNIAIFNILYLKWQNFKII